MFLQKFTFSLKCNRVSFAFFLKSRLVWWSWIFGLRYFFSGAIGWLAWGEKGL